MKTISFKLDDDVYNELDTMLKAMSQAKQTFFETYVRTVINEGCIPFIIKTLNSVKKEKSDKMKTYEKLEYLKKTFPIDSDVEKKEKKL